MRYSPEHKEQTRRRILDVAARLFRRHGYDGVAIDDIMAAADLTRGGFYGHFPSKKALFAEVVARRPHFVDRFREAAGKPRAEACVRALELTAAYLDPANRDAIAQGCSFATLSPEVARVGGEARRNYEKVLHELVRELERPLAAPDHPDPRALATVALMIGGIALTRAVADDGLAARIAAACHEAITRQLHPKRRAARRRPRRRVQT